MTSSGSLADTRRSSSYRKSYGLLLLSAIVLLLCFLYLIRYLLFLPTLHNYQIFESVHSNERLFPELSDSQVINLGWAHTESNHPRSSYLNFSKAKPEGVVRIGIFGGSFVYGQEAAYGFDYPSLLQDKFSQSGLKNIQVINFGVIAYGMHQSYLLWEYLGRDYDLDYVVLNPFAFHQSRDTSFVFQYNSYGPIHARYILSGNKLKLLSTIGNPRSEASRIYNSLFPTWQYVRYDSKPPMFLRLMLPLGRQLHVNPFYYKVLTAKAEIYETYSILIDKLAKNIKTIVTCQGESICRVAERLTSDKLFVLQSQIPRFINNLPDLYRAPLNHWSALGNEAVAAELFSLLTGQAGPQLKAIDLTDASHKTKPLSTQPYLLHEYRKIAVQIGEQEVASFVAQRKEDPSWQLQKNVDFQEDKTGSLLWVRGRGGLKFIPLPFLLKDNEPVFITFKLKRESFSIPIGSVETSNSIVGKLSLGALDKNGQIILGDIRSDISMKMTSAKYLRVKSFSSIRDIAIVIGERGQVVLRGVRQGFLKKLAKRVLNLDQTFTFEPVAGQFVYLRAKPGNFVDINTNSYGTLDLVVTSMHGPIYRYPILPYKILPVDTSSFKPPFSLPILVAK